MGVVLVSIVGGVLIALLVGAKLLGRVSNAALATAVGVVLMLVFVAVFLHCSSDALKVDRCLDRGGRWNEETETCEF